MNRKAPVLRRHTAYERLWKAVDVLATSARPLPERLKIARIEIAPLLEPSVFERHLDLQRQFDLLLAADNMSAEDVASAILTLFCDVADLSERWEEDR